MFRWLRRLLRRDKQVDQSITIRLDGENVKATVFGVTGLRLLVRLINGDVRLIPIERAVEHQRFTELWKRFGGDKQGLRWDDGSPFDFEENQ